MLIVRRARLWFALLAEILLLATLHRFDDWHYETMPVKFVETAVLCGIAFLRRRLSSQNCRRVGWRR